MLYDVYHHFLYSALFHRLLYRMFGASSFLLLRSIEILIITNVIRVLALRMLKEYESAWHVE